MFIIIYFHILVILSFSYNLFLHHCLCSMACETFYLLNEVCFGFKVSNGDLSVFIWLYMLQTIRLKSYQSFWSNFFFIPMYMLHQSFNMTRFFWLNYLHIIEYYSISNMSQTRFVFDHIQVVITCAILNIIQFRSRLIIFAFRLIFQINSLHAFATYASPNGNRSLLIYGCSCT